MMHDRENAIRMLCIERECVGRDCDGDCAICDLAQDRELLLKAYDDALKLLKGQEPVKPYKIPHSITHPGGAYVCGNCKIKILETDDGFCPGCGRAVKWG